MSAKISFGRIAQLINKRIQRSMPSIKALTTTITTVAGRRWVREFLAGDNANDKRRAEKKTIGTSYYETVMKRQRQEAAGKLDTSRRFQGCAGA